MVLTRALRLYSWKHFYMPSSILTYFIPFQCNIYGWKMYRRKHNHFWLHELPNTHMYMINTYYELSVPMISYNMFISIHIENNNFAKSLDSPLSVWILLYTCHYFVNAKKKELHPLCTYAMLKNVNTLYIIRRNLSPFNVSWGSQLCMVREAHRVNSRDSWSSSYLPPHCL